LFFDYVGGALEDEEEKEDEDDELELDEDELDELELDELELDELELDEQYELGLFLEEAAFKVYLAIVEIVDVDDGDG
jgi:hypothetical protein